MAFGTIKTDSLTTSGGTVVDLTTITTDEATTTSKGYMSAADKTKLDGIEGGVSDGDKGDIVVSGTGATWTVEAFSQDIDNTATGYIAMPAGTTAQRPGTPANGQQRYNSDLGAMEVYVQGQWQPLQTDLDYGLITASATTTLDYGALS